jgi:hypothetical protein
MVIFDSFLYVYQRVFVPLSIHREFQALAGCILSETEVEVGWVGWAGDPRADPGCILFQ